jgi:hypothetical protein
MNHPENPRLTWPIYRIVPALLVVVIYAAGWMSCEILYRIKARWNRAALVESDQDRKLAAELTEKTIKAEKDGTYAQPVP